MACTFCYGALPQPAAIEIQVDHSASSFTEQEARDAVAMAAARLTAATGRLIVALYQPTGETTCQVSWFRGFEVSLDTMARSRREPACEIQIRAGFNGVRDVEALTCVVMHEIGHLLVGSWHSEDEDSFMHNWRLPGDACEITQDFVEQLSQP